MLSIVVNQIDTNWNHIFEEINYWYHLLRGVTDEHAIPAGT